MLSHLRCVLNSITFENGVKDSCYESFVTFAEKCPRESLLKEVTLYVESRFFWKKSSFKYDFLEIYEQFNMTNSTNLGS